MHQQTDSSVVPSVSTSVMPVGVSGEHRCVACVPPATVNGIRFDPVDREGLVRAVESFVDCGRSHVVQFLACDPTVRASRDANYACVLNAGDLNIADGLPIAWTMRLRGREVERIAGTEGVDLLCDAGRQTHLRHYLYGGSQEVNDRLGFRLRRVYSGLRVAGAESPRFGVPTDEELAASAARIKAAGTDLLWIGVGTPTQHYVASKLRELEAAPVILCVGAAFDFVSGTKKRAPKWMQRSGLEWLHRMLSEPKRLGGRYLVGNPRFVAGVVRERLSSGHR
jgi:N-acetylglucosaminyldiphosphoundecaprenol N-acetyl-beta-D-mannosaminyltransferase